MRHLMSSCELILVPGSGSPPARCNKLAHKNLGQRQDPVHHAASISGPNRFQAAGDAIVVHALVAVNH